MDLKAKTQFVISDEEFEKLIMSEIEANVHILKTDPKGIFPRLLIYHRKNFNEPIEITPIFFMDFPEDKHPEIMIGLGSKYASENKKANGPIAVTLVSEAWTRTVDKAQQKEFERGDKAVRDYDDKKESIIVAGCTLDKRQKLGMVLVERNEHGDIIPGKLNIMDGAENRILQYFFHGYIKQRQIEGTI